MTLEGKHRVNMALDALEIGGQTNTSGGLLQALDIIRKRKEYGPRPIFEPFVN